MTKPMQLPISSLFLLIILGILLLLAALAVFAPELTENILVLAMKVFFSALISVLLLFVFANIIHSPMQLELFFSIGTIALACIALLNAGTDMLYKSRVTEALGLMSGAKTNAVIHYTIHGEWPASKELEAEIKTKGNYVHNIHFSQGTFSTEFKQEPLNQYQLGFNLAVPKYNPLFLVSACGTHPFTMDVLQQEQALTTLPSKYLPFICK